MRLLEGGAEERLLHELRCQARGLLKARGRQRTDVDLRPGPDSSTAWELLFPRRALRQSCGFRLDWLRVRPRWRRALYGASRTIPPAAERGGARELCRYTAPAVSTCWHSHLGLRAGGEVPKVGVLRQVWARHFDRGALLRGAGGSSPRRSFRPLLTTRPGRRASATVRPAPNWVGYVVSQPRRANLLTHVDD